MAKKIKLTRKQMKQPDEFLSWTEQVWEYATKNSTYILGGIAVFLVLFFGVQIVISQIQKSSNKPDVMLGEALETMRAPIIPAGQAAPYGLPRYFNSEAERLDASAKAFAALVDKYGSSTSGKMAMLYLAETNERMHDYPKAAEYYQKFLQTDTAKNNQHLKLGATVGLGRALFEQNKLDEALAQFEEVINANGAFKDAALMAAARTWVLKGDKAKSDQLLATAREEFPNSYVTQSAGFLTGFWAENPPKPGQEKPMQVEAAGLDLGAGMTSSGTAEAAPAEGGTASEATATIGGTAPDSLPVPVPLPPTSEQQ